MSLIVTLGNMVTLSTQIELRDPVTGVLTPSADAGLTLYVTAPDGTETPYTLASAPPIVHSGTNFYYLQLLPDQLGDWAWRWLGDSAAQGATEGAFTVESDYVTDPEPPDLTDLRVLVPWTRRACEGPFGPPAGLPMLVDSQLYAMVADACAEVILFTGSLFGHQLLVAARDPRGGFPTEWKTEKALELWEGALLITQVALNYYFHVFRDMKTSQSVKNEGTEWEYTLSANVLRDYLASLKEQRDMAIAGLQKHYPIIDKFASTIRVRDQATVAVLEWWAHDSGTAGGLGLPGGQEAYTLPWIPGWFPGGG
jgi:hypothetical protein